MILLLSTWLWSIEKYQIINQAIIHQDTPFRAIRSYELQNRKYYLIVNERTLKTKIIQSRQLHLSKSNDSNYQKLLNHYSAPPYRLQNYGLTSIASDKIYITTDLCPSSKKGYERAFYQRLIQHYPNPVEITLFISSRWIDQHPKAFEELRQWHNEGKLNILWGNHTHTHPYSRGVSLKSNFLLSKGVNIEHEIIGLEKKLIAQGITPSIFFRFPGLVQNQKAIKILKKFGLIAVGSNAWLAKGEKISKGSIILLHGNKNEPQGIKKANILFKQNFKIGSLLDRYSFE